MSPHRPLPGFARRLPLSMSALLCGLALLALPHSVQADDSFSRPGFYIGVGGSYQLNVFEDEIEDEIVDALEDDLPDFADLGLDLDDSYGLNARVGYRLFSFLAIEAQYEWVSEYDVELTTNVSGVDAKLYSIEGHTFTANTRWFLPLWRFQPYLLLGGGISIADVDRGAIYDDPLFGPFLEDNGVEVEDGRKISAAGRAGLGLDLYLTRSIVLNAEAGAVVTTLSEPDLGDIDDLNYLSFSAGLQYRF